MKRFTLTSLLTCATLPLFASLTPTSSGDTEKMETLFQCGEGTERGFEGWMIEGLSHKTITYFENQAIEFFQYDAGTYSIGFIKRIDEMVGFNKLRVTANLEQLENCAINYATAYVSRDGKDWSPLTRDARYGADGKSDKMECQFVKIVADVCFYNQGRFKMKSAQVFGRYEKELKFNDLAAVANGPAANPVLSPVSALVQEKEEFFVFTFEKSINVETQNDGDYDFVLSNLLGQVIVRQQANGSDRFELDVPDGVYFVTILQDDKLITTKKVVL